jgi:hypothetical protein
MCAAPAEPLRCVALTKAGQPCRAFVSTPDGRCGMHGPRAAELHALGGVASSKVNRALKLMPSRLRPVMEDLETAFGSACKGELSTDKGHQLIAPLARALVAVYEAGVREEAIQTMQQQIADLQRQQGVPTGPTRALPA